MSETAFDATVRRDIRAMLVANGVEAARAGQIVDLACHAEDRAVDSLVAVIRTAPDNAFGMMSIELALQLAPARMASMLERAHKMGSDLGLRSYAAEVAVQL